MRKIEVKKGKNLWNEKNKTWKKWEKGDTGGFLVFFSLLFLSLHLCVICFMERLLQINIIGIHRRVLSHGRKRRSSAGASRAFYIFFHPLLHPSFLRPTESPRAPLSVVALARYYPVPSFFFFFLSHHPVAPGSSHHWVPEPLSPIQRQPLPSKSLTPEHRRRRRRRRMGTEEEGGYSTSVCTTAVATRSHFFYYSHFLEFFQWCPALFHGLSLL